MANTEGTVTGAGAPRADEPERTGEQQERDLFPGQESGKGPSAAAPQDAPAGDVDEGAKELQGDLDELVRTTAQRD